MTARIEIKGMDKLLRKVKDLEKMDGIKAAIKLAGEHIENIMKTYPPERLDSTYRRTGSLRKQWTKKIRDKGFTIVVGNAIEYGPFVQSQQDQAWMHKGFWHTDEQVVKQEEGRVKEMLADAINKIINS